VQTWVGGTSRTALGGPGAVEAARVAVRTTRTLGADEDVVAAAAAADARCAAGMEEPGTLLAAYGINPGMWQLVTFTLHSGVPASPPDDACVYRVLHLSTPEHDALPTTVETRMSVPR
jgi:hypothetical protein